jgi:hypothetical protein
MERSINTENHRKPFLEYVKIFLSDGDSVIPDRDSIKSSVASAG